MEPENINRGKITGSWGYRVRGCNVAGCTAFTVEEEVVVTRPPTVAPTLTVPTTNTTGSYTTSWTAVTHATSYELQERLNSRGIAADPCVVEASASGARGTGLVA